jgi:hypothetical protein
MTSLRVAAVQASYVLMDQAGPVREKEETLFADLDLGAVLTGRRHMDPAGHYNRPDIFRLHVDTSGRPAFVEYSTAGGSLDLDSTTPVVPPLG